MLKTTLGILSKMQKQPKFPSADEWGKKSKMYTYNRILFGCKKE